VNLGRVELVEVSVLESTGEFLLIASLE